MDPEIEKLLKEAKEIEAELNALDKNDENAVKLGERLDEVKESLKPFERKMRFDTGANPDNAHGAFFVRQKRKPEDYTLEEIALGRMILNARGSELPDEMESKFQSLASKAKKYTLTTEGEGTGAELVDTILWGKLLQDVHAATLVANLFERVDMPSGTMELSEMSDAVFYKPAGEGLAVTATDPVTGKRILKAYTLKAQVDVSDEESEDAVIAMIPELRGTLVRNAKEVIDEAILNADASPLKVNINYYYPTTGADIDTTSRFLIGFDGLIHYCLNELTATPQKFDLATIDVDDFATFEGMLGKYSLNPAQCAYIFDQWTYRKAKFLSDFTTVEKMGDKATLLTGQLGAVGGIPVIVTDQILKSCATGQVHQTAANNTLGRALLVHRPSWKFGMRRNIRVNIQRDEAKTLTSIVASMRIALQCFGDRTDAKYCHTALGYNATV